MSSRTSQEEFFIPKDQDYRHASVLIILIPKEERIYIPFIKRPKERGPHSQEMSFPGGAFEENDETFSTTALRETEEEIGIPKEQIQILGKLSSLYIPVSRFLVHPFLGYTKQLPEFKIDPKEVEKLFLFSLEDFLDEKNRTRQQIQIKKNQQVIPIIVPVFRISDEIIWGATAMIMNEFLMIYKDIL
ncbi:MAG: CoA pyrophosphatase [Leptospiraceae bacterium]|nr:CoA pyrophosphatase [Leptospiraceae bacterium]